MDPKEENSSRKNVRSASPDITEGLIPILQKKTTKLKEKKPSQDESTADNVFKTF
jgi:hypothetical protein